MHIMTVGFAYTALEDIDFKPDDRRVLLVKKRQPEFMKSYWNGVGGKCKYFGENPIEIMEREWGEETGFIIDEKRWEKFAIMYANNVILNVYRTEYTKEDLAHIDYDDTFNEHLVNDRDELMRFVKVKNLMNYKLFGNTRWLVLLGLDQTVIDIPVIFNSDIAVPKNAY